MALHISGSRLAGLLLGQPVEATRGPAYLRLADTVRTLVLDGRVPVGARLPAERELATRLGVSRTTVTGAYAALRETGHATARQGAGTFTALPPGRSLGGGPLMAEAGGTVDLDLAVAAPGPADGLLDALAEAVAALPAHLGHGYHPAGLPVLREAVAARFTARGLPTAPTQVVVTAGAQAAIDLVARHLLRAGDAVVVENPTYPNAVDALRRAGARLVGTPVDEQGWDTDSISETYARSRPRLGYHVVDFHNPTGLLLDDPGRARLVEAASSTGTTLLVDETQAELGLDGGTAPRPVAAFDREGRVVTVGSMSKAFWGGLRIGWVRTSPGMAARLAEERAIVDMASPVVDQLTAVVLLGAADRLLPARRAELRRRRDRLTAALGEHLPAWTCPPPPGGVCAWARLDEPVSTALTAAAGRRGLRLAAGPRFGLDGTLERYLRLPYTLPADDLEEAVRRLAAARAELGSGSAGLGSVPAVA